MMNVQDAKRVYTPGTLVTWSSGEILAKIATINPSDETATVVLHRDYHSPCGQVFAAGTVSRIPLFEIRCVN